MGGLALLTLMRDPSLLVLFSGCSMTVIMEVLPRKSLVYVVSYGLFILCVKRQDSRAQRCNPHPHAAQAKSYGCCSGRSLTETLRHDPNYPKRGSPGSKVRHYTGRE